MFESFGGDGGVTGGLGGGGVEPWPFEWEPDGCDIDWSLADLPDAYADGAADGDGEDGDVLAPEALLAQAVSAPPGRRATGSLAALDPGLLPDGRRLDLLLVLEQQIRWLRAAQARALAVIEDDDQPAQAAGLGVAADEVSLTLRISGSAAQSRLKTAHTLTRDLPATLALLAAGAIDDRAADLVAQTSWRVPPDEVAGFEAAALRHASTQTPAQLGRAVRRALHAADPDGAARRHEAALTTRQVRLRPECDGMAELVALLPAVQAHAVYTRVDAATALLPACDRRTRDQQRADLLVDAVLAGIDGDALPKRRGRAATALVTVAADTLLGLDEQPGELAGYGPITAAQARRAAAEADTEWRRLLTEADTGQLADANPREYRPNTRLVAYLHARDQRCVHPTCEQPAWRCDVEHQTPFDHQHPDRGGQTTRANTAMLCRRHHNLKTRRRSDYRRRPDGHIDWTDHTSRTHTSPPEQPWPTPTPTPPTPAPPAPPTPPTDRDRDQNRDQDRA